MLIGQRKRDVVVARRRNRIGSERNGGRGGGKEGTAVRRRQTRRRHWTSTGDASVPKDAHTPWPRPSSDGPGTVQRFTKFPLTTCSPPLLLVPRRVHGHKVFPGTDTPRSRTSWESTVHDIQGRRGRAGRVFDDPSFFFFLFFFEKGWVVQVEFYRWLAGYWRERCSVTRVWV